MWGAVVGGIFGLLNRVLPNKEKQQEFDHDARKGQQDINKVQAGSQFFFVAGARAFLMWALGIAFVYQIVLVPTLNATFNLALPTVKMDDAFQLLLVLLGA